MCEKKFNDLVSAVFLTDYQQKYMLVNEAEQKASEESAQADDFCNHEVANLINTMETFKLIVMEKMQKIEQDIESEFSKAKEKYEADIKVCEHHKGVAQKQFEKSKKDNETKNTKRLNANAKAVAEIEKKFKADVAVVEKKHKEEVKKREKEFKVQADGFAKKFAEIKESYDRGVATINVKIKKSHDYYKKQEQAALSAFNEVKTICDEGMIELQEQYNLAQNEFNEQIKHVTEKQRIKVLRTHLALAKSSYESGMLAKRGELATAQKIYNIKHNDAFSQLVKDVTGYQQQLRGLKAAYDFDQIEISNEQKIADAENKNRVFKEDRVYAEEILGIELWRQDELNKMNSISFCGDFDTEILQKETQLVFDIAIEEENKNIDIEKLNFEIRQKEIDTDKIILMQEQNKHLLQNEAKTVCEINKRKTRVHHYNQTRDINVYSLLLKSVNKSQKLLNCIKCERNAKSIQQQIEEVNRRLEADLALVQNLKEYQFAELDAIRQTAEAFFEKQTETIQKLYNDAVTHERNSEANIFAKSLASIQDDRQTAFEHIEQQAKFIDDMIVAEEERIREQSQKELSALQLFIKEYSDMTDKYDGNADDLRTKADEAKKDTVVDLLAVYEGTCDKYNQESDSAVIQFENEFVAFMKSKIIERENFIQEIEDKKLLVEKDCKQRQDEYKKSHEQFVKEAEKNKSISKGMLGEQLCKSFDKRQDKKNENVQFFAQKANELKSFENSCHRAINDAKKEHDKKFNEFEKMRIKEERWLLRNGKVSFDETWWIVEQ